MKKVIFTVLVAGLLLSATNVSAMSKEQFEDKLTKSYEVNGGVMSANESQKLQIERYLAKNNISESDLDVIAKKFDEALAIVRKGNATSLDTLTKSERNQIIALINQISKETDVKITISNGVMTIYNLDGTVFTEISDTVVKYTNDTTYFAVVGGIISFIGIVAIALKIRKANA